MKRHDTSRRMDGFSLLEALIAVVVLSAGLLALAALQGSLARSSADAKVRSQVSALLVSRMDELRSGGYSAIVTGANDSCAATPADNWVPASLCTQMAIGALNATQTVATLTNPNVKRITLNASWTDVTGANRSLQLTSDVSALALETGLLPPPDEVEDADQYAVVRTKAPDNVIPIAVGANTDTAATNPKPSLGGSEGTSLPSTSFNVLTYGGSDNGAVRIQQRVENEIVQCTCQKSSTPTFSNDTALVSSFKYRPTYWDGNQYTDRKNTLQAPDAGPYVPTGQGNKPLYAQHDLCDDCCRDHHDVAADDIKFHNLTTDYNKYPVSVSVVTVGTGKNKKETLSIKPKLTGGTWEAAASGDIYINACRIIRVDGLWQVATDMQSEHMGLLVTETAGDPATAPEPEASASTLYEDFVQDYLASKVKNVVLSEALPDVDAVYDGFGLNEPSDITALGGLKRYLHARGLYIDHLEESAIQAIKNAYDACQNTDKTACALRHVPFNTVNVTELANWSVAEDDQDILTVTNASGGDPGDPIRGVVATGSAGTADADVKMGLSNSAVTSSLAVSPAELDPLNLREDAQRFIVVGSLSTSNFFVRTNSLPQTGDLSTNNDPFIKWTIGSQTGSCTGSLARDDTDPNDYRCRTTAPLDLPVYVDVAKYNLLEERDEANPCSSGGTVKRKYLVCYALDSAALASGSAASISIATASDPKTKDESTRISVTASATVTEIATDDTLEMIFVPNGEQPASFTCDAAGNPVFTDPTSCP